jgi:hypothetical protein
MKSVFLTYCLVLVVALSLGRINVSSGKIADHRTITAISESSFTSTDEICIDGKHKNLLDLTSPHFFIHKTIIPKQDFYKEFPSLSENYRRNDHRFNSSLKI